MSNLCGWFGQVPEQRKMAAQAALTQSLAPLNLVTMQQPNSTLIAQNAPSAQCYRNEWGTVALLGHLEGAYRHSIEPLDTLLQEYRRNGPTFLQHCRGEFALVIILEGSNSLFLASDRLGTIPLHYQVFPEGVLFSTYGLGQAPNKHDPVFVYRYLYSNMPFTHEEEPLLKPAHYLTYRQGQALTQAYWQPRMHGNAPSGLFEQRKRKFNRHLNDSISRYSTMPHLGMFYQHDLASVKLISQFMKQHPSQPFSLLSISFEGQPSPKVPFHNTSNVKALQLHNVHVTPQAFCDKIPQWVQTYNEPMGYLPAVSTYFASQSAYQKGINTLLSSEGAKTLFVHSSRYWIPKWVRDYHRLPSWAQKTLEPMLKALARQRYDEIRHFDIPTLLRVDTEHWINRIGTDKLFTPDFIGACKPQQPIDEMIEAYDQANATTCFGKMQILNLYYRLSASQIRYTRQAAEMAAITAYFPYLSDDLLDFSFQLPDKWKVETPQSASFFTRLLQRHAPGLSHQPLQMPLSEWVLKYPKVRDLMGDALNSLKSYGFFQESFVDLLLTREHALPPAQYNGLLWQFASLAFWLEGQKEQRATQPSEEIVSAS